MPPEVRTQFEDHLSLCRNCRTYLRQYQQTVSAGRAAFAGPDGETSAEVPDDLVQAILAARSRAGGR